MTTTFEPGHIWWATLLALSLDLQDRARGGRPKNKWKYVVQHCKTLILKQCSVNSVWILILSLAGRASYWKTHEQTFLNEQQCSNPFSEAIQHRLCFKFSLNICLLFVLQITLNLFFCLFVFLFPGVRYRTGIEIVFSVYSYLNLLLLFHLVVCETLTICILLLCCTRGAWACSWIKDKLV